MKKKEKNNIIIGIISISVIVLLIYLFQFKKSDLTLKVIIDKEVFINKNQLLPDLNLGISHDSIVALKKKQLMNGMSVIPNYEFQCCIYQEDTINISVSTISEKDTIVCFRITPILSQFESDIYKDKMGKSFTKYRPQNDRNYQILVTELGMAFKERFINFYGKPRLLSENFFYWKHKNEYIFLKMDIFNAYVYVIDENNLSKCADILLLEELKSLNFKI